MIVTVCTVGYGDFYPLTDFSRIVIGIFIVLIIVLVSKQTSELNELMKFSSEYKIPYRGGPGKNILLLGNISANTLNKFLKEFYHPDHNMQEEMKVVLV
jgi:Ion channel